MYRKYKIKDDFFDCIDTKEKAYFLGLLYADGYNNEKSGSIKLSLKEDDKQILETLNKLIFENKPLQFNKSKNEKWSNIVTLQIVNRKISNKLVELGCMQAKSFKIKFPQFLPENLISHFIRGYFDGDGHISKNIKKRYLSIVSTGEFNIYIKELLLTKLQVTSRLIFRNPKNRITQTLVVSGDRQIKKVLDYIYKDATIYLDRKYQIYKNLINILDNRDNKPKRKCILCERKHYAKNYCNRHYELLIRKRSIK